MPAAGCGPSTGETFNRSKLGQDIQELTDYYKDQGYAYVNVIPLTDGRREDAGSSTSPSRSSRAARSTSSASTSAATPRPATRSSAARCGSSRASCTTSTRLELSKRRITALGFFEKVDVSTKRGDSDDKMEVNVEVAERPTGTFQIGAGFSSVENFIAQAQISQNNLFGRGQSLSLQAQLSSLRQLFLLRSRSRTSSTPTGRSASTCSTSSSTTRRSTAPRRGGSLTWGYLLFDDVRTVPDATSSRTSGCRPAGAPRFLSGGQRTPFPAGTLANLLRSGLTSSVAAVVHLRHARQPPVPDQRLVQRRLGRVRRHSSSCPRTCSPATTPSSATSTRSGGRSCCALKANVGLVTSRDPAGRADLRALLRRRHLRRARLPPLTLGPRIRAPSEQTPDAVAERSSHRRQHAGHRQRRDRVPALRAGRASGGVVFTDTGNAYNLEDQYCRLRPANAARVAGPLRQAVPARPACAPAGASASAGSRRSARCASSGASRSSRCPARSRSSSSSPSATIFDGWHPRSGRVLATDRSSMTGTDVRARSIGRPCYRCASKREVSMKRLRSGSVRPALARFWRTRVRARRGDAEARLRRPAARPDRDRGRAQGQRRPEEGVRPEAEGAGRAADRAEEGHGGPGEEAHAAAGRQGREQGGRAPGQAAEGAADLHAPPAGSVGQGAGGDRQDLRAHAADHRARSPRPRTSPWSSIAPRPG